MCIVCIANNINRNVYIYLNTRIFPTTGYARVLLFMFIGREPGGTGTGCLFQFTYCGNGTRYREPWSISVRDMSVNFELSEFEIWKFNCTTISRHDSSCTPDAYIRDLVCLGPVNSYGHVGMVSSLTTLFSLGKLDLAVN